MEDCIDGGAPKAEAAAAALRRIAPELDVTSVPLTIRMPGHPPVTTEVEQAIKVPFDTSRYRVFCSALLRRPALAACDTCGRRALQAC